MDSAHVYCRKGPTLRYAVDHKGLRDHQGAAALLRHDEQLTPCEVKSIIFTSESGIICVALGGAQELDDVAADKLTNTTYVLQIPRHDVDVVVRQLVERDIQTVCMHFVSELDEDIQVAPRPPDETQLVHTNDRPPLPCTTTLSVATLHVLSMISWAREHHIAPPQ